MQRWGGVFLRKRPADKVTGAAKYNDDYLVSGMLYAKMATSSHAHARIGTEGCSGTEGLH